jgi:methanogenic corrinoid protein MtbC1
MGQPTATMAAPPTFMVSGESAENLVDDLRHQWIAACLIFDERTAEAVLSQAFSLFPAETVCIKILQGGLAEIGEGWHQGRVTVQQEHFASELAIRRLEALLSGTPAPTRPGRVILGCPADEQHTFVPLMLSVLLRRRGFDVVYLGANIPLRSMAPTISTATPKLVILTAQQLFTAASLLETGRLLESEGIPLAYGGLIFRRLPELTKSIPGHYLGDDIEISVQAIEQILVAPRVKSATKIASPDYVMAHDHFRQHQAEIEAGVWQRLAERDVPARQLDTANRYMGLNIRSALQLGNMDFVGLDLVWIEELLVQYYEMPSTMVRRYLQVYYEAALEHLDQHGEIVVEWLGKLLGRQGSQPGVNGASPTMSELFGQHRVNVDQ